MVTGEATSIDATAFDQRAAAGDLAQSRDAPPNRAGITRIADHALVYELRNADDELELVVLPVSGLGLWGIMYGFIALDADLEGEVEHHRLAIVSDRQPAHFQNRLAHFPFSSGENAL